MSMFRLMMLSYVFHNFDKVLTKVFYMIVCTYLFSAFAVVYHEGISSLVLYKNPLDLYYRMYQILKWYYFNRSAITSVLVIRACLLFVFTYLLQHYVWSIRWRYIPLYVFGKLKQCYGVFSIIREKKERNLVLPSVVISGKGTFISKVEEHVDELLVSVMSFDDAEFSSENITRLRKICAIKIGYAFDDLISLVIVNKEETMKKESPELGAD